MEQLVFQLVPAERNHLIKVCLLAARQSANIAAFLRNLRAGKNGGAEFRVSRNVFLVSAIASSYRMAISCSSEILA